MRQDLEDQLVKDFPNLYRNYGKSPQESCMAFGCECGDGWFRLIYNTSEKLEQMILELPEKDRSAYGAAQIKQKFGELRIYLDSCTDEMFDVTMNAGEESKTICEQCGKPGKLREIGRWLYTSCEEHKRI